MKDIFCSYANEERFRANEAREKGRWREESQWGGGAGAHMLVAVMYNGSTHMFVGINASCERDCTRSNIKLVCFWSGQSYPFFNRAVVEKCGPRSRNSRLRGCGGEDGQAMEERAKYLDEALLSNAFAWMRKATDDGQEGAPLSNEGEK